MYMYTYRYIYIHNIALFGQTGGIYILVVGWTRSSSRQEVSIYSFCVGFVMLCFVVCVCCLMLGVLL